MGLWRLEWLRLVRTPRALALLLAYLFFGLSEPILTKYESQIVGRLGGGARITLPPVTPAAGVSSYFNETWPLGMIVVVVIAAGALSFDAHHGIATFLRTRASGMWQLLAPRFVACTVAAIIAFVIGALGAWYETDLLIGPPAAGRVAAGILSGSVYLIFAVAVTSLVASVVRGTLGTVGLTLIMLVVLPVAGLWHVLTNWLPSTLASVPVSVLSGTHLSRYLPAFCIAIAASAGLLALAVIKLRSREV
jgi:ABC-2 type transport system permease protein